MNDQHQHPHRAPCLEVPELRRNQFFFGQMLGPRDFVDEQSYFREKLKLHNRCLHGHGVACGLAVVPASWPEDCDPPEASERATLEAELQELQNVLATARFSDPAEVQKIVDRIAEIERRVRCLPNKEAPPGGRTRVRIRCGIAYDCEGNELVVRRDLAVDLLAALPAADRAQLAADPPPPLWLSLCFCEQPVEPSRPVLADACGAAAECVFGKLRDAVRVRVSLAEPAPDERCETCCSPCGDPCVLLARIDGFVPGQPVEAERINNGVRRPLSVYVPTRVAAVNWTHGAEYSEDDAYKLLKELEVRFTRSLLSSTVRPGVMDVWVIAGGSGRHADIYNRDGALEAATTPLTDRVFFRQGTEETLQLDDRVLITLRTSFLLDRCCRPVDGENVGGRVPILAGSPFAREPLGVPLADCLRPPGGLHAWTSGEGAPAGTFESWFFVRKTK